MPFIEERVETLEEILAQTLRTVEQTSREMQAYTVNKEIQSFREKMCQFEHRAELERREMNRLFREDYEPLFSALRPEDIKTFADYVALAQVELIQHWFVRQ